MVEYAYPSLGAALHAAFSPSQPYYGSGSLRAYTGTTSAPSELNALDRGAQAALVYAMLSRELSAERFAMLAAKYLPAREEAELEQKIAYVGTVARQLSAECLVDESLTNDVVMRLVMLEPVGHYSYDWARWLDVSPATVYRHADKVKKAWYARMDAIFERLAHQFDVLHIAPF